VRVVLAVGGNALLPRGGRLDAKVQLDQLRRIGPALAALAVGHELVVVHGNGPQVGLLALESSADAELSAAYPLDDLVAETQGMIGYWLQQTITSHGGGAAVTLVSQTVVDADDPAFAAPTKFIGPTYDRAQAEALAAQNGWEVRADGAAWRRVVPSPLPRELVELEVVDQLLGHGVTVVVAGGGGIPVIRSDAGLRGVEAVVDKDLTAALVAQGLGADLLVVATDVPALMTGFGTADQRPITRATPTELDRLDLPAGSMGPKVQAVAQFVAATGGRAVIGALDRLDDLVTGSAGTQVVNGSGEPPRRSDGPRPASE
jgi:carbamate kinase